MSLHNTDSLFHRQYPPATFTILIVDDDPVSRLGISGRLKRVGYALVEAENGQDGLAVAHRIKPDLMIVDWMMPELDGPSVCETLRADPDLQHTQVILMTAHDQPEQIAEGLTRGADDFVSKSASTQELLARIQTALRARTLVRQIQSARDDLQRTNHLLNQQQQQLDGELQSAARFVMSLLPPPGEIAKGVRLAWKYFPSLVLGGDLFHVTFWSENRLGFFILDASGHGVSAALRAASLMTFLQPDSLVKQVASLDPGEIVTEVNRRFPLSEDGDYFTLWVGAWDLESRELRYCTAGHSGALLVPATGQPVSLAHSSFPVGFQPTHSYTSEAIKVPFGTRLFLFSDGLYETQDSQGTCLGISKLGDILKDCGTVPLEQAMEHTVKLVRAWHQQEYFTDDAALVGIEMGMAERTC